VYDTPDSFFNLANFTLDLGHVLTWAGAVDSDILAAKEWDANFEGAFAVEVCVGDDVLMATQCLDLAV
jgi:hypothetical protein